MRGEPWRVFHPRSMQNIMGHRCWRTIWTADLGVAACEPLNNRAVRPFQTSLPSVCERVAITFLYYILGRLITKRNPVIALRTPPVRSKIIRNRGKATSVPISCISGMLGPINELSRIPRLNSSHAGPPPSHRMVWVAYACVGGRHEDREFD